MIKIFLITNETHGEGEDTLLLKYLQDEFQIQIYDISQKLPQNYLDFDIYLFRNAWPGRIYSNELLKLYDIANKNNIIVYNSLNQKTKEYASKEYLRYLYKHHDNVIPTYDNLIDFPNDKKVLIKPKNGGSSYGVEIYEDKQKINKSLDGYLIQEYIPLKKELSFYFVDKVFIYALRTRASGMENRWELEEFKPSTDMLSAAHYFVEWNNMEFGVDRIDFGLTDNNKLLLMEIESDRSYFSLEELSTETLASFIKAFKQSLYSVHRNNHK